jgi:hypothetical protein
MWRDLLGRVRQRQLPEWGHYMLPVEAAMDIQIILLQYGLGTASFLGLDGGVYWWNAAEGQPPCLIEKDQTVSHLIVWASHVQPEMPDLTELLPPPNGTGVACAWCEGRRWFDKPEEEWPGGWVCMLCRGMGWVDKTRLPRLAPHCRTEAVIALARAISEGQQFHLLPILADALEESGCDNQMVLEHCREPGEHLLDCWVADLVLAKE